MSIEIIIDPNVRVAGNRTYAGFEDVLGGFVEDLRPGDPVTVREEESNVIGDATVFEVNDAKKLVYLDVNWASLRPRHEGRDWVAIGVVAVGAAASVAALVRASIAPQSKDANLGQNLTSTAGAEFASAS